MTTPPRSIQGRMLLLSVVATLVALGIAGWTIVGVLERVVTAGLDRRLDSELAVLASVVSRDGQVDRERLRERTGALEGGPGWRWRIAGPDGVTGSRDFPVLGDGPPRPHGGPREDIARDHRDGIVGREGVEYEEAGRDGAVHARQLVLHTTRGDVTLSASAPGSVVRRPVTDALAPLLGTLAALAALLGIAAIVQLRVGLRPLRRLRDQVAAIRGGTCTEVDEDQPLELRPLASELNALARDTRSALSAARLSAANLAHALKNPVATLALDVRDEPGRAAQVARIDATIRHHLARARRDAVDRRAATALAPAVADMVATIGRLHAVRGLSIATDVPGDLSVAMDAHDLDELLGNLLDNAARHAASTVRVDAGVTAEDARIVRLRIADDGPGISPADRARVAQPGTRLDERGDGHGFGLSIVADMLALYGGGMTLGDAGGEAGGGGLVVEVTLPAGR